MPSSSDAPVTLVTGAAVRIGRSIALRLASQGHAIAIHYNSSADEAASTAADCTAAGAPAVCTVSGDLSRALECRRIVAEAAGVLGPLTNLINSAAIFERGSLTSTDEANWTRHLDINLAGPFWMTQAFCADRDDPQNVINIVDWRARRPPAGHLAYTVSKAGLVAMTELLAQELAPRVRVNGVAPGPMLPPPGQPASYLDSIVETIPLKTPGCPEDIAHAVAYLLDAPFVTGHILHVTGGQEFGPERG